MKKIIGNRDSGKTRKLIETALENGGIIVCDDPEKMIDRSYRYGLVGIRQPISYDEFTDRSAKGICVDEKYYIDELERYLTSLQVGGFTLIDTEEN